MAWPRLRAAGPPIPGPRESGRPGAPTAPRSKGPPPQRHRYPRGPPPPPTPTPVAIILVRKIRHRAEGMGILWFAFLRIFLSFSHISHAFLHDFFCLRRLHLTPQHLTRYSSPPPMWRKVERSTPVPMSTRTFLLLPIPPRGGVGRWKT